MSAATETRPVQTAMQGSGDEAPATQSASGFTAVNGRSPTEVQQRQQPETLGREQDAAAPAAQAEPVEEISHTSPEAASPSEIATSGGHSREASQASLGKRKRSLSGEPSPTSHAHGSPKRYRTPGLEASERDSQQTNGGALHNGTLSNHHVGSVMPMEQDNRYGDPNAQHWNIHRDGEMQDAQFAEALTRGTQQLSENPQQMDHMDPNAEVKYTAHTSQGPPHPQHPMSVMPGPVTPGHLQPSFQKQRKRNFSNRTKTGCLTCRSRKKKCDENKPTCKNCERGGFTCQGYSVANPLYKSSSLGAPVAPLQAKSNNGGFYDPYNYSHNRPAAQAQPQSTFYPDHAPHPPVADRDRNMSLSQDAHARGPYGRPASWSESQQPAAFAHDTFPPGGTSLNDHRGERTLPPPPNPLPPASQRSGSTSLNYANLAQSALNQSGGANHNGPPQSAPQPYWTEKDKMLRGLPFASGDKQLVEERKQCATACYKFNQGAMDPRDLTEAERTTLLRKIIKPKSSGSSSRSPPSQEALGEGSLGERVTVEPPFNCEYGYNVTIGSDTEIRANCRIMDSCSVKIGARCYIGPNVTFFTADIDSTPAPLGPGGRKQKRLVKARQIVVEDDVFITGNVVIQPGRHVGTLATIAAGTTLDRVSQILF